MGNTLPSPVSSIYVERKKYSWCKSVYSCIHGYRFTNEDAHIMNESKSNIIFNGVFDGHAGDTCSKYVASLLANKISEKNVITPIQLKALCLDVDSEFLSQNDNSGSTATFSIIKKDPVSNKFNVTVGNIGDSMTIILEKKNNYSVKFITTDHKPTIESEKKRIEEAGGYVEQGRVDGSLSVSRAFGDKIFKSSDNPIKHKVIACPDINEFECDAGDIVVHFCDGIIEYDFSPNEVVQFITDNINKYQDLAIISSLICREALIRGSRDNLSCLITVLGCSSEHNYPEKELIPGEIITKDSQFIKAYQKMSEMGGETLENTLNKRLKIIQKCNKNNKDNTYEREIEQVLLSDKLVILNKSIANEENIIKSILNKQEQPTEIDNSDEEINNSDEEIFFLSSKPIKTDQNEHQT